MEHGFPTPGPQSPNGQQVMNKAFFLDNATWKAAREEGSYDYVVIGTGPCSYAFADRVLSNNASARILMLERGPFFLPEHFQNLPLPMKDTLGLGGLSETFPWTLSKRTARPPPGQSITWMHGQVPYFGGRSTLWSSWCPRPTREEMSGWPEEVVDTAFEYFESAEKLLEVKSADDIELPGRTWQRGEPPVYGKMQHVFTKMLQENLCSDVPSATRSIPAPLAVGGGDLARVIDFDKYSNVGPLLQLVENQKAKAKLDDAAATLDIATECCVERIVEQDGSAVGLQTSRGVVSLGDAKLVLGMGALPPATLLQSSFGDKLPRVGSRFTAHFISAIVGRVPRSAFNFDGGMEELEIGAHYVAGETPDGLQYHIQLSSLSDTDPAANAALATRYAPDVVATASPAQLADSSDYVVFVAATLGEIAHDNPDNWFRANTSDKDPTTASLLQIVESDTDRRVWDTMDEGTYQVLEKVLSPGGAGEVEYWHGAPDEGTWKSERPPQKQIRVGGLVHEGSTLYIGKEDDAPVDLDYKPRGVDNVYITGAGLWPRSGSWNPTMTMVGLAQHLADKLEGANE